MKAVFLFNLLLFATSCFSQAKSTLKFNLAPLYARETFRWSVAGDENGNNPNILSELRFKDIQKTGILLEASYQLLSHLDLTGGFKLLKAFQGNVTDIDYAADNREQPTSTLDLLSNKGQENNYHLSINYQFLDQPQWKLTAGVGYNITKGSYYMHTKEAIRDTWGVYTAHWQRPNVSLHVNWAITSRIGIQTQLITDYLFYTAEADWLLRTDFNHPISFTHHAYGIGINGYIGGYYRILPILILQLETHTQRWETGHGTDILYLSNGNIAKTRMNESVKQQNVLALKASLYF